MKALKIVLIALAAIIVLLVVISQFLPSKYAVERNIVIKAQPENIFPYFNELKKWPQWSVWYSKDSTMKLKYNDIESGVGALETWTSENLDNGMIKITVSRPVRYLEYELSLGNGSFKSTGKVSFVITKQGTRVTWGDYGDFGWNPIFRYFNFFVDMDKYMGPDFEMGLAKLKAIIEENEK